MNAINPYRKQNSKFRNIYVRRNIKCDVLLSKDDDAI